jgi:hypothetical protein
MPWAKGQSGNPGGRPKSGMSRAEYHRKWRANFTPEQQERYREQYRKYNARRLPLTPEQRERKNEKCRVNSHKYYWANLEKVRKKAREWSAANRAANPEKVREYDRKQYWATRERHLEGSRKWRVANREQIRNRKKAVWAANREKLSEEKRKSHAAYAKAYKLLKDLGFQL